MGNLQDRSYWTTLKDKKKVELFALTEEEWDELTSLVDTNNT